MKHSETRTIPIILFLDKTPRISESTLFYFKMLIEQKVSNSLLITYANTISKLIDYKMLIFNSLKTKPQLFLDQFIKDLTLGKTLNWKPLIKKTLNYEILIIKEYSRWLSKHQDLLTNPQEKEFAQFISTSYKVLIYE
jgi:site-specific recombinase XerC